MTPPDESQKPRRDWRSLWAAVFLIRPDPGNVVLAVWLSVALASMVVASAVAVQPGHLADLWLVRDWLQHWFEAGNPYIEFHGEIDYPPASFLVLWPLGLPPDSVIVWLFIPGAIAGMALAGWILVRWLADWLDVTLTWQAQAALVAVMLSGGAARGGIWRGQTAALAVLLGALALRWCRSRPAMSAIALALCAYKPHVAVGFGLAIALTERRDVVAGAVALVAALSVVFAASIGYPVTEVVRLYGQSLVALYDGPDRVPGLLSIRWVIEDLLGNYLAATTVYVAAACAALLLIIMAAAGRRDAAGRATVAAVCLLWPLVFLPNQLYHGVLAWPAIWLIMWPESGVVRRPAIRLTLVTLWALFSVIDLPRTFRQIMEPFQELVLASYVLSPLRMALLLGFMLYVLTVRAAAAPAPKGGRSPT